MKPSHELWVMLGLVAVVLLIVGGAVVGLLTFLIGFVWALVIYLWVLTLGMVAVVVWLARL